MVRCVDRARDHKDPAADIGDSGHLDIARPHPARNVKARHGSHVKGRHGSRSARDVNARHVSRSHLNLSTFAEYKL
jgi:hypothetical protein